MMNNNNMHIFDLFTMLQLPDPRIDEKFRDLLLQELNKLLKPTVSEEATPVQKFTHEELKQAWKLANSEHAGIATKNQATNYLIEAHLRGISLSTICNNENSISSEPISTNESTP